MTSEEMKQGQKSNDTHPSGQDTGLLREEALQYGTASTSKLHTIEDYYALPDDQRVELIDGVFYDMAAPTYEHQMILGSLHSLFLECARLHGQPCEVFMAPCDVLLDRDDYTMVQPDLLIICEKLDFLNLKRLDGAPALVAEILSPSTRSRDMILKLYKYQKAGVREYWIIDPKYRIVTVHRFDEEEYHPVTYTFQDEIPVGISDGMCAIDFSRILERVRKYEYYQ